MKFILILFILLSNKLVFSQNTFSYLGSLLLSNNKPISFSLELNENKGVVNGYSITNIGLEDETKSEISGLYFRENKSFQLYETQILSTKSEASLNTFCYINMTLTFKGRSSSKRLEGTFTGNFLDSIECAKGRIILMEKKKIEKKITKLRRNNKKKDTRNLDTSQILQTQILKDGDDLTINWESNNLRLFVWDANKEDGDKITLIINDNPILTNFKTKNKRKRIKYKLQDGENIIKIIATNVGNSPPNTSRIEMIDKKTKYPIIIQMELGKTAIIKIIK